MEEKVVEINLPTKEINTSKNISNNQDAGLGDVSKSEDYGSSRPKAKPLPVFPGEEEMISVKGKGFIWIWVGSFIVLAIAFFFVGKVFSQEYTPVFVNNTQAPVNIQNNPPIVNQSNAYTIVNNQTIVIEISDEIAEAISDKIIKELNLSLGA